MRVTPLPLASIVLLALGGPIAADAEPELGGSKLVSHELELVSYIYRPESAADELP